MAFRPLIKQIRWGGRRLGEVLNKTIGDGNDYAESWEVVDHGDDQSVVCSPADSEFVGLSLNQIVHDHGAELFGSTSPYNQFPLLIKFLDASDRLSVQVHPDDELARTFDPTENGKTEAWVILDAEPGAKLYAGLKAGVTEVDLRTALDRETVEELLHTIEVHAGDCLFIPAGTVHAIGEGVLLAEVQQSSDMTFRLYDWARLGTDGQPRPLHIEESIRATDWEQGPVGLVQPNSIASDWERLVECPFFTIDRRRVVHRLELDSVNQARVLIGLNGEGEVRFDAGSLPFGLGKTVLVPANCEASVVGEITFLDVLCP